MSQEYKYNWEDFKPDVSYILNYYLNDFTVDFNRFDAYIHFKGNTTEIDMTCDEDAIGVITKNKRGFAYPMSFYDIFKRIIV